MLDCLETSFLQVLVPVALSYFPEVLIYIHPTQKQQKENIFSPEQEDLEEQICLEQKLSIQASEQFALLVQFIRHDKVFTFPI